MTQEQWLTASVTMNVFLGFGIAFLTIWTIQREYHVRDVTKGVIKSINSLRRGFSKVSRTTTKIAQHVRSNRTVDKEEQRQVVELLRDQKQLALDIEERLGRSIDRTHGQGPIVQVGPPNFKATENNFNGDNATVAQGQQVKQSRNDHE